MKKKNTLIGSDFEKICRKICCLKAAQLIKSAHRLHIFGIRRFDNTKYFKIDKGISLGKYFIEIDHLPIQPFHCCTPSFPPPIVSKGYSPHVTLVYRRCVRAQIY